jgi:malate permease and related proteins
VFSTIFLIIALGFFVQKRKPFSSEALSQLSNMVVSFVMPFYIFYTTATNSSLTLLNKAPLLVLVGAAIPLVGFIIAQPLMKLLNVSVKQKSIFQFCIMYGNTAFLGIPVSGFLFGSEGAFYAVMYNFGAMLVIFSLGMWLLSSGSSNSLKNLLTNPIMWSMIIGIIFAVLGIPLPQWIDQPLATLSNLTLPIALLVAGAQIGSVKFEKKSYPPHMIAVILSRLIVLPGLLIALFAILGWISADHKVMILESAMPVGISSTIFARNYGADSDFSALATLWTTVLSLITLPVIAWLFLS